MGKLSFEKMLDCFYLSSSCSCFCINTLDEDEFDKNPLLSIDQKPQLLTLKDVLKPKMVVLRVSMHCSGCARKVAKHVSKLEGVNSYKVDLDTKMVVVIGDILPFEVLESVSKVKYAELWNSTA
ncbi:hypothetical protein ACFE04_015061 [Oxalis oulophora]